MWQQLVAHTNRLSHPKRAVAQFRGYKSYDAILPDVSVFYFQGQTKQDRDSTSQAWILNESDK